MTRMTRCLTFLGALAFVIAVLLPAALHAQKRGLIVPDYYREVVVSDVAMSPAGNLVAFTVTTVVEKDNKRHREVWMLRLKNGGPERAPDRLTAQLHDSACARLVLTG